ncbi:hypothetical protein [Lentzea sp. NPDC051838]|uniref:hypothetical protein n=1 Tax=Lentzea sp. NPDC051838 TaxID=3154849 RepID=UPI00341F0DAE
MKYFVIRDGGPVPRALVRTHQGVVETFTGRGEWVEAGPPGTAATEVDAYEFYDHVYEAMRDARAGLPCVALLSTTYRADELINVDAVMRVRDGVEEWLDRDNVWRAEHPDLEGKVRMPISEEELDRLKWTAARPEWFVVHDERDYPYAVVRKIPSAEEAFTRDLRWESSDLLGRTDLRVEKQDYRPSDQRAALEIGVRRDRQRARGGPEYFTLWPRVRFEPAELSSVIRRTKAGEEVCVGHSGWLPSRMLDDIPREYYPFWWVLPISPEEADEILARRAEPRYYHVLSGNDGLDLPHAVVEVDGGHEKAFTWDLAWAPSDLLSRIAEEPDLHVQEFLPDWGPLEATLRMARAVRRRRRSREWNGQFWYHAVFPGRAAVFDLSNATELIRTVAGSHYPEEAYRDGAWTRTYLLEDIGRGKADGEDLPISPAEAEALMRRWSQR